MPHYYKGTIKEIFDMASAGQMFGQLLAIGLIVALIYRIVKGAK